MLREGFHRSFAEFFSLLQRWNSSRLTAGEGSALWQQRPLEEQPHKLETLKEHLTRAEAAERASNATAHQVTVSGQKCNENAADLPPLL